MSLRSLIASSLFCLCVISLAAGTERTHEPKVEKKEYVLNTRHLGLLFHRATSAALLQAKAKKELRKLPASETLVFEACAKDARTLLNLNKCVSRVLDRRDAEEGGRPEDPECSKTDNADGSWLTALLRSVYQHWKCPSPAKKEAAALPPATDPPDRSPLAAKSKTILRSRYNRTRLLNSKPPSKSANFEWKKRRVVRSAQPTSPRCKTPKSVQKLRNVDGYFKKMNEVLNFVYGVSKSNERFLNEADARAKYRFQPTGAPNPTEKLRSFIEELENYQDKAVLSFLSPQLLNLLPQRPLDPDSQNVLSPNMLSFQDEGMLPLPRLLQMSTSDHCETLEWLDLLMEMTGGTRMLTSLMQKFGNHMTKVEEEIHPRVRRAHAHDEKFVRLDSLTHEEQRRELEKHGYARMNKQQMEMIYGKEARPEADDGQPFEYRADELTERAFENEIRQIARMTEEEFLRMYKQTAMPGRRPKRDLIDQILPMTNQKQLFGARVLQPFAFSTRIRSPNVIGPYIISPYAFYLQVASPTLLGMELLSPRAFVATIFSPIALLTRVLSPSGILGIDEKPLLKEPLDEARARAIAASNSVPELAGG